MMSEVQTTRLELNSDGNRSSIPEDKCDRSKVAKDERHTPKWGRKVQREHEAKHPGPPKKSSKREKVCITISDDEPDEDLGTMGDDWSLDLWDELVKDKPEHWDIRDALKHGKKPLPRGPEWKKSTAATGRKLKRSQSWDLRI